MAKLFETQGMMTTPGEEIASMAWCAFRAWCRDHDPDGELSELERFEAYRRWCDGIDQQLKREGR